MKLVYRGVHYNYTPASTEVIDTPIVGQYRGSAFKLHQALRLPNVDHILHLIYRGAPNEVAY
jgi:hypothetical protein